MRNMHKQILEDADMVIENFKKSLPSRVLKLTMSDLKNLNNYGDIDADVQQTMNDLNMTVKETIQKADEGNFGVISNLLYLCGILVLISLLSHR